MENSSSKLSSILNFFVVTVIVISMFIYITFVMGGEALEFFIHVNNNVVLVIYDMVFFYLPGLILSTFCFIFFTALPLVSILLLKGAKPDIFKKIIKACFGGVLISIALIVTIRFIGPLIMNNWLDQQGYQACSELSDFEYNRYNLKAFVLDHRLCTKAIPMTGETAASLLEKLQSNQIGEELTEDQKQIFIDTVKSI